MGSKNLVRWVVAVVCVSALGGCLRWLDSDRLWPCETNDDCESSERCLGAGLLESGACYDWPCDRDADCGDGLVCADDGDSSVGANKCIVEGACESQEDCTGGLACLQGTCSGRFCSSELSTVCGAYACDGTVQACREECVSKSHCKSGIDCVDGGCVDLRCSVTEDSRCGLYTCDGGTMHCREVCQDDDHCQGDNRCEGGQCEPPECTRFSDSACGAYLCNGATLECSTQCASADDCSMGNVCLFNECVAADSLGVTPCTSAGDCEGNFACDTSGGACRRMCTEHAHCDDDAGWRCADDGTCSDKTEIVPGVQTGIDGTCHLGETGLIRCWGWRAPEFPTGTYRQVSMGRVACAQHLDGALSCRGIFALEPYEIEIERVPDFEAMDAAGLYTCGLVAGEVHCFEKGRSVGILLEDVRAMAVTSMSDVGGVCAITNSGALKCTPEAPEPPAGNFTKLDCSANGGCCAISMGGELICWGRDANTNSLLDVPEFPSPPVAPICLTNVNCAVLEDNTMYCWGNPRESSGLPRTGPLPSILDVSGNGADICGRTAEDIVYCWRGSSGQYDMPEILEPGDAKPN